MVLTLRSHFLAQRPGAGEVWMDYVGQTLSKHRPALLFVLIEDTVIHISQHPCVCSLIKGGV